MSTATAPAPERAKVPGRLSPTRIILGIAAPLTAVLVALVITSAILIVAGKDVGAVWSELLGWPIERKQVLWVNSAMGLYLSGVAVAIGFRMNLFNIGVEGQLRVAHFAAAYIAGFGWLPGWLNIIFAIVVAMTAGALWAGIAAWLKVTRGVNEVVSTIMLNWMALGILAWLMTKVRADPKSLSPATRAIPEDSRIADLALIPGLREGAAQVYGFLPIVILVGVAYWFMLNRTRFGFDLRATGRSETAAQASGVNAKRMVIVTMLLSGAVAGLVQLPVLFGDEYIFKTDTPMGLGFAGIAVALIGRNHPLGIALGALLWSYLDTQAINLSRVGVSNELVAIIQGIIVLAVVIAYEVIRRVRARIEQADVARALRAAGVEEAR